MVYTACMCSSEVRKLVKMNVELVPKSGTKSIAWDCFGFEKGADGLPTNKDSAICCMFFRQVQAKNANTTNLMNHLKTRHTRLYSETMKAKAIPQRLKSIPGTLFKNKEVDDDPSPFISKEQCVKAEISLNENAQIIDSEDAPLVWWKSQIIQFYQSSPKSTCVSTQPVCPLRDCSENLDRLLPALRSTLKPECVNMLTFF